MKFTEAQLEAAIIELLGQQGYPHVAGTAVARNDGQQVLIEQDLRDFLSRRYASEQLSDSEIDTILTMLTGLSATDLYDSNKQFCQWLSDGFSFKREHQPGEPERSDIHIKLLDFDNVAAVLSDLTAKLQAEIESGADDLESITSTSNPLTIAEPSPEYLVSIDSNIYKLVNQLEIEYYTGVQGAVRIPDAILYINGLPLVVFEFKSAIREDVTIESAYHQLTKRYRRDIPQLFVFNAFCVISDGVNNKMGTLFADYDYYYAWRKVTGDEPFEKDGIDSLHTMLQGLFDKSRLRDVCRHFIFFPDKSKSEVKIICRYPQYYAAKKLFAHIKQQRKPFGDGRGGTYFGATGCGKSYTMQFLTRLLMKDIALESPTIVLITDRTDLDDQLSQQFTNAKVYIGDETIKTVESRADLRAQLKGRQSGGVFLTTIHKFNEDINELTDRFNVVCISDEAHRSQLNLDQKVRVTEKEIKRTFGFAKYLHDSLPNATYVGFTGTPIDATLDVFGPVIDSYTMKESVADEITVRIVYEGRAAKVILDNSKLEEIERYYQECEEAGANEHQIEQSKRATTQMGAILGDPDRIAALAKDFVAHYEKRIEEGASVRGKAMFVSSSREIAYDFYQQLQQLRPEWFEVLASEKGVNLSEQERKTIKPSERVKMVMTRGNDDSAEFRALLGTKDYRKSLDQQFKSEKSNFKIAIVVDMWLTGFDVPFLDSIYIDKPIQRHNLIQTISRVNRTYNGKDKGLVIDYIGIKSQMNKALAQYGAVGGNNVEDINQSLIVVKDHLDLLNKLFHQFDSSPYFTSDPIAQLNCLNNAGDFVLQIKKRHTRFMGLMKRLRAAYDVCCGSEKLSQQERDLIHFYFAVRSIVFKLTKGDAPDISQMNAKVRDMVAQALHSSGVEEIYKLGENEGEIDIFDDDYMEKIGKIKLPNTKIQLLQKLLEQAIEQYKQVNLLQGIDFSKRFRALVDKYNERREKDVLRENIVDDFFDEMTNLFDQLKTDFSAHEELGISFEEKVFFDILKSLAQKHNFTYPDDKLTVLAKEVKLIVDDKVSYPDWSNRDDIKAGLRVELILLLAKYGYPPVDRDEVYQDIFKQAQNYKKHRG